MAIWHITTHFVVEGHIYKNCNNNNVAECIRRCSSQGHFTQLTNNVRVCSLIITTTATITRYRLYKIKSLEALRVRRSILTIQITQRLHGTVVRKAVSLCPLQTAGGFFVVFFLVVQLRTTTLFYARRQCCSQGSCSVSYHTRKQKCLTAVGSCSRVDRQTGNCITENLS